MRRLVIAAAAAFEVAGFGTRAGYISRHVEHHMLLISGHIVALAEDFAGASSCLGEHPHGVRWTKSSSVAHGRFWESMQAMARLCRGQIKDNSTSCMEEDPWL